jgi:hypothetical protein
VSLLEKHPPRRAIPDVADALALESRLLELEEQLQTNLHIEPLIHPTTPKWKLAEQDWSLK